MSKDPSRKLVCRVRVCRSSSEKPIDSLWREVGAVEQDVRRVVRHPHLAVRARGPDHSPARGSRVVPGRIVRLKQRVAENPFPMLLCAGLINLLSRTAPPPRRANTLIVYADDFGFDLVSGPILVACILTCFSF